MTRDINKLHPYEKYLAEQLIAKCKEQGITIIVTGTLRTMEEQAKLYNQGRTTIGPIVTNAKAGSSMHNYGLAFDVCINMPDKKAYDNALLVKVGKIGMQIGLTWGGSFKTIYDSPHFEWTDGLSLKDLQAGKRPPNPLERVDEYEVALKKLCLAKNLNFEYWKARKMIDPSFDDLIIKLAK
jgi:peptidoglycan L-alanyl-D-glutamate endopeptidase CwlK